MKYPEIVKESVDKVVAQVLRDRVSIIMVNKYGGDWWDKKAETIFQKYPFYKKSRIDLSDPLKFLDVPALLFLLFPYDKSDDSRIEDLLGLARELVLTPEEQDRLKRLRKIRNDAEHNQPNEEENGEEDRKNLRFITNALKPLKPDISKDMNVYFSKLNEKLSHIESPVASRIADSAVHHETMPDIGMTRPILPLFAWELQPISDPILGELPWKTPADLKSVPLEWHAIVQALE